jgi:hypothetical protein
MSNCLSVKLIIASFSLFAWALHAAWILTVMGDPHDVFATHGARPLPDPDSGGVSAADHGGRPLCGAHRRDAFVLPRGILH